MNIKILAPGLGVIALAILLHSVGRIGEHVTMALIGLGGTILPARELWQKRTGKTGQFPAVKS